MDGSAGMKEWPEHARHSHGSEVTPDRDSLGNPAPKRARRRLETDNGSDEADDTHDCDWGTRHAGGGGRQEESKATKAQLLSESVIELLHVCTLIQVALNNSPPDEHSVKHDDSDQDSSHASSHAPTDSKYSSAAMQEGYT